MNCRYTEILRSSGEVWSQRSRDVVSVVMAGMSSQCSLVIVVVDWE